VRPRAACHIQKASDAPTDFILFPGRSHLLIEEPGWEDVAAFVIDWAARRLGPMSAKR